MFARTLSAETPKPGVLTEPLRLFGDGRGYRYARPVSPSTRPAFLLRRASEVAVLLCVFCISSLAAAAPLPPSTGSLPPKHVPGRRRQPDGLGVPHRLAGARGRKPGEPLTGSQRPGHGLRRRQQRRPACALGLDHGAGRSQSGQVQHPRRVGGVRPTRRRRVRLPRVRSRERAACCPRGHDLPDVRAQPRRAALEQRESGHPLPNDRGRSRLLPGDRERRLGDPATLGHQYVG